MTVEQKKSRDKSRIQSAVILHILASMRDRGVLSDVRWRATKEDLDRRNGAATWN